MSQPHRKTPLYCSSPMHRPEQQKESTPLPQSSIASGSSLTFVFLYFAVPFYSSDNTFSIVKNPLAVNLFTILRKSPAGTQQFSPNLRQFKNHSRINIIRILNLIQLDNGLHMLCVLIIIPAYFQQCIPLFDGILLIDFSCSRRPC